MTMNGKRGKNRQTHLNKCIFMTDFPHRFFHGRRTGKDSLQKKIVCSLKKSQSQRLAAGGFLFLLLPPMKKALQAAYICGLQSLSFHKGNYLSSTLSIFR